MIVIFILIEVTFGIAAMAALYRVIVGPTVLDRILASDVLLAIVVCTLAVEMVYNGHTNTLPVMLVLAIFAVVGSVSVSRFLNRQEN